MREVVRTPCPQSHCVPLNPIETTSSSMSKLVMNAAVQGIDSFERYLFYFESFSVFWSRSGCFRRGHFYVCAEGGIQSTCSLEIVLMYSPAMLNIGSALKMEGEEVESSKSSKTRTFDSSPS